MQSGRQKTTFSMNRIWKCVLLSVLCIYKCIRFGSEFELYIKIRISLFILQKYQILAND